MTPNDSAVLVYALMIAIVVIYLSRSMRALWYLNPSVWAVIGHTLLALGSIGYLEFDHYEADLNYAYATVTFVVSFVAGVGMRRAVSSVSGTEIARWRKAPVRIDDNTTLIRLLIGITACSVAVGFIYYRVVGYNILLSGLRSVLSGENSGSQWDAIRLTMYSGEEYFAPGYVNQFKNTLLPLIVAFLIVTGRLVRRRRLYWGGIALVPVALLLLCGTGQRGPLVLAFVCLAIFLYSVFPAAKTPRVALVSLIVIGYGTFMVLTVILGREVPSVETIQDVGALLWAFPRRLFEANQLSGVEGFRYVHSLEPAWGSDWLAGLMGILPGPQTGDSPTAHVIHGILYGTTTGTAPLTLVGSIWFNFRSLGVTVGAFILGFTYESVHLRLVRGPKTTFRLLVYSAVAIILGSWVISDPRFLVDNGLVTMLILNCLGKAAAGQWPFALAARGAPRPPLGVRDGRSRQRYAGFPGRVLRGRPGDA